MKNLYLIITLVILLNVINYSQPNWTPVIYTNSTTAYGIVTINGSPAEVGDSVAAFVSGECRAVGGIVVNQGTAYTTLLIQGVQVETVYFKVWDSGDNRIDSVDYSTSTSPGNTIGTPPNYLPLNGIVSNAPGWTDNFESGIAGTFPSGWTPDGNGTNVSSNYIDNTVSFEGSKSLHLYGTIGGCWASIGYHPINLTPPFTVVVSVRDGDETLSGCNRFGAGIKIRKGYSWANPERYFVLFDNGNIYGGDRQTILDTYSTLTWYKIKISYEEIPNDSVKLSYWINDIHKGSISLPAIPDEKLLLNLELTVFEGTAWFDNIKVDQLLTTGIDDKSLDNTIPKGYSLIQNYPNPFNPSTIIKYDIPNESFVTLKIFDILGREVATLVNEEKPVGKYKVSFSPNNLVSGVYFYRINAQSVVSNKHFTKTGKMILMK